MAATPAPRITERYSRALQSSDLTLILDRASVPDVLIAVGWAAHRYPLGAALARAVLAGGSDISTAVAETARYGAVLRERHKLGKNDQWWLRIAEAAVKHWLDPVCGGCAGRKFIKAPDAPLLLAHACLSCRGTGEKRYPIIGGERLGGDRWRNVFAGLLTHLDTEVERTLNEARNILTRNEKAPRVLEKKNNTMPGARTIHA